MELVAKDKEMYVLTVGGVVAAPFTAFSTVVECAEWAKLNTAPNDYCQWVKTVIITVEEVPGV